MTFKKTPWSKSEFWEISIDWLQESFNDNEVSATEYLNWKFWIVSEQIKEAVKVQLMTDWNDLYSNY